MGFAYQVSLFQGTFGKNAAKPRKPEAELFARLGAGSYGTVSKVVHKRLGFHMLGRVALTGISVRLPFFEEGVVKGCPDRFRGLLPIPKP